MKAYAPLLVAAIALVSCQSYDEPAGHARVARQYEPVAVAAPTPQPVAVATPAPAAEPAPVQTFTTRPKPISEPLPAVAAPVPDSGVGLMVTRGTGTTAQQPAQQSIHAEALRNQYPLMPGQNRGLRSRGW